ncbi:Fe-only nitrogenase accessory AnfO family protein [Desulfoscipio gibsoniae]|uniref:Iron only nitrogenase protein AnfO (AnfO_nitrog) n=1 Tax=Desulfoscipio gibsoniae DSM 7213 TaxID=767817 RepID=R4KQB4_9FIRM|nr:Fe-only nitrogenase accessory AnfO family protein [Desulfoscipio gibsoniae]AGL01831.1 Iron only nitrogenase protein AnfO (AnfO_nitrog) [Desulfoscipio gibsoniae DSM 7213]
MSSEIAVWVNENGETTTLNTPGKIVVYRKWQGNWKADRDKVISPPSTGGMSMLRRLMSEVLEVMGKSKIFVAQKVTGIPYFELEKSTCSVWEMPGKPEDFLDYILSCEEKEQSTEQKNAAVLVPAPVEIGAGRYRVSIKEIQESGGGITSKQVLQPFLSRGKFFELEVICNHVPPWLEAEFIAGTWKGEVTGGGKKIIISKTC